MNIIIKCQDYKDCPCLFLTPCKKVTTNCVESGWVVCSIWLAVEADPRFLRKKWWYGQICKELSTLFSPCFRPLCHSFTMRDWDLKGCNDTQKSRFSSCPEIGVTIRCEFDWRCMFIYDTRICFFFAHLEWSVVQVSKTDQILLFETDHNFPIWNFIQLMLFSF